ENGQLQLKAPPRIIHEVIENGSLTDDDGIQKMWAGLLASSATSEGKDDSNIPFVDILRRMTSGQAKLIEHVCVQSDKGLAESGIVQLESFFLRYIEAQGILGCADVFEVKSNLGHMRSLGLLQGAGAVILETNLDLNGQKEMAPNITPERFGL